MFLSRENRKFIQKNIFLSLDKPTALCYNTPNATGKRVKIPREPVAVSRMPLQTEGAVLPPAAGRNQVIGYPPRRPTARAQPKDPSVTSSRKRCESRRRGRKILKKVRRTKT